MFIRMSVLIAVVVGVALSISGLTPRNVTKQTKPEQSSEAEGGIKLLVSVSKEHFQVGEPILLKLVLKNDTSQVRWSWFVKHECCFNNGGNHERSSSKEEPPQVR
jgi:hypothetical protein